MKFERVARTGLFLTIVAAGFTCTFGTGENQGTERFSLSGLWSEGSIYAAYPPSSDPLRSKQTYLDLIHMNEAWQAAPETMKPIVVAVVDTGVDLKQADLVDRLVPGINLLDPNKPPQDNNGHGTNVAGVIASAVNNGKGITGIAPNAKVMPIKALEADGTGGEAKLIEGIRYAVDHGANIVVLSLGLNKSSASMAETVQYAENHGVLLVAAVGNEGNSVKYPAAYSEVLAVGGANDDNQADPRSNFGPEVDLVAPWTVFTTRNGGGYEYAGGTSMAAPQVAAAAALAWGKYPSLKPFQLRNLLVQTAEDLGAPGWDEHTGYGLLRVDQAMTAPMIEDRFEPNNSMEQAAVLPLDGSIQALLTQTDQDWYELSSAYEGIITLQLSSPEKNEIIQVNQIDTKNNLIHSFDIQGSKTIKLNVTKGKTYIQLIRKAAEGTNKLQISYTLATNFVISADNFEDNDKQYQASVLPARTQTIKGTFHQTQDRDWYQINLPEAGELRLQVSVDTARIDPVLRFEKAGDAALNLDEGGDGDTEATALMPVTAGTYFIRISNIKDYSEPIAGQYTLSIAFRPKPIDANEPNDTAYKATFLPPDVSNEGVIDSKIDKDWFSFHLDTERHVQLFLTQPTNAGSDLSYTLYSGEWKRVDSGVISGTPALEGMFIDRILPPGTYYVQVRTAQADRPITYSLRWRYASSP